MSIPKKRRGSNWLVRWTRYQKRVGKWKGKAAFRDRLLRAIGGMRDFEDFPS